MSHEWLKDNFWQGFCNRNYGIKRWIERQCQFFLQWKKGLPLTANRENLFPKCFLNSCILHNWWVQRKRLKLAVFTTMVDSSNWSVLKNNACAVGRRRGKCSRCVQTALVSFSKDLLVTLSGKGDVNRSTKRLRRTNLRVCIIDGESAKFWQGRFN